VGEALVDQLVDRGLVKSVADLYQLTANNCCRWSVWAKSRPPNVLTNIARSKLNPMPR